jgi:chemotaxis protein MotB
MQRRRRKEDEHENSDRWLVSYADFITLLFAFFVVMYAISSVNEGKYRVLSNTLADAFSNERKSDGVRNSPEPIPVGELARGSIDLLEGRHKVDSDRAGGGDSVLEGGQEQIKQIAERLKETLSEYIIQDFVSVNREGDWIEIEMKSALLFASGSAELSREANPMIEKLAAEIRTAPYEIHVEGHTDDKPINTPQFPSNWELSVTRAASVVHEFGRQGVDPRRMAAIGYGEFQPIGENKTEEGRFRNRRVVVVLLPPSLARHGRSLNDPSELFKAGFNGAAPR